MPSVRLTGAERRELQRTAWTTRDARVLCRAQALLDLDRSDDVGQVARFRELGPSEAALSNRPRPGRPRRRSRAD